MKCELCEVYKINKMITTFEFTFGLADGVPGGAPPPPGIVTAAVTAAHKQNKHNNLQQHQTNSLKRN